MNKEFPEQKNIFHDVQPEHARGFDFVVEDENAEDRKRGVLRIRDGGDTYTFSLSSEGRVVCHGDLKRLSGPKAGSIMGLAFKILTEQKARRDSAGQGNLEF